MSRKQQKQLFSRYTARRERESPIITDNRRNVSTSGSVSIHPSLRARVARTPGDDLARDWSRPRRSPLAIAARRHCRPSAPTIAPLAAAPRHYASQTQESVSRRSAGEQCGSNVALVVSPDVIAAPPFAYIAGSRRE